MATETNRRALLGALAAAPVVAASVTSRVYPGLLQQGSSDMNMHTSIPAMAATDSEWAALVADFRGKHAVWVAAAGADDSERDAFNDACDLLPPRPQQPGSGLPDDILNLTIAQIKAAGNTPEHKAVWAEYEQKLAAWESQREELQQQVLGPSKARYDATYDAYASALNTLTTCRTSTLAQLAEKIEIIAADHEGFDIPHDYLVDVLADVRHMAGNA